MSPIASPHCRVSHSGPKTPVVELNVKEEITPASLEWDTYSEEPEFQTQLLTSSGFSSQNYSEVTLGGVYKIPIVSTDYSDLESMDDSLFGDVIRTDTARTFTPVVEEITNMSDSPEGFGSAQMAAQVSTALEKLRQEIVDDVLDLPAADIVAGLENQAEKDRDRIWNRKNDFRNQVRSFIAEYGDSNPDLKTRWEESLDALVTLVADYRKEVTIKIETIRPTIRMTEYEKKSIELQERAIDEKKEKREEREKADKEEGLAKAKKELMSFRADYDSLTHELTKDETPYKDRDDISIAAAMQNLKGWKDIFSRLSRSYREYESLASVHGEQDLLDDLDDAQTERVVASELYEKIKSKFDTAKKEIEKLDSERGLYSNQKPMGEKLDYPKFSGSVGEDYLKFHEKMVKALRYNQVAKADQVERLRKNLTGFALGLVPESTETIDKAFTTLKAAFGDPKKVLDERMKKLKHVGDLPADRLHNNKNGFRKQEEWYLNVEGLLYDLIELGKRDDDMAYEVFSANTFNFIVSLFPIKIAEQLEDIEGDRKQKLSAVLEKLALFREKAHRLGRIYGDKVPPGGGDLTSGGKISEKHSNRVAAQPGSMFKDVRRNSDCRICGQLEADGVTDNLYEDHISTYPTGCPKFISMKMVKRKDIAIKAKFCLWCLDPEVIYETGHRDKCRVKTGKIKRYSCEVTNCKNHMWLCSFHKQSNSNQLKKHQEELKRKGLDMALANWCMRAAKPTKILEEEEAAEAITKAVRRAARDNSIQVNPIPSGRPLFLFAQCKGKRNGVNCFFDKGCTEAVFRKGIPGTELIGEKVTKGPFTIGGVGGLECKANDEWIVSMEKTDGHRQLIRGLTVDKVTENFPMIKLSEAAAELKAKCKNEWVRNCKLPKQAGGVTDALIGIHYNLIHPEPIHTLETGLCIFRSKLAPHKPGYIAMLGGPHSSFDALVNQSGGTARMIAQFVEGLEMYRAGNWTPPKLPRNPATIDEIQFAKTMNAFCGDKVFGSLLELEEETADTLEEYEEVLDLAELVVEEQNSDLLGPPALTCVSCDVDMSADVWLSDIMALEADTRFEVEEKVSKIKNNWSILESGLQIEYKCVKCRDCTSCRNASQTEKISLREENEMQLIRESVYLDWDRKKIVCSLPLRGKEREFLSSNRERALMVLDQQCRKWFKDDVNRPKIIAAFEKLFKTGDTRFLHQLSEQELSKFIHKEVQYFIPWRVVYNDSPSTPVRPVLDASTGTSRRPDGSGGRCLNDLVAKGRIETMNLLRLALRFVIGLEAMTGDLSQFYYSCELVNEQWNLQRFLWRENLDPSGKVIEGIIGALIYGVKCVSPQTEFALEEIANKIDEEFPMLAALIRKSRYVDDFAESRQERSTLKDISRQGDEVFARIGLKCKGWSFSGEEPLEAVSKGSNCIGVAGQKWWPRLDVIEIPVPELHFGAIR